MGSKGFEIYIHVLILYLLYKVFKQTICVMLSIIGMLIIGIMLAKLRVCLLPLSQDLD